MAITLPLSIYFQPDNKTLQLGNGITGKNWPPRKILQEKIDSFLLFCSRHRITHHHRSFMNDLGTFSNCNQGLSRITCVQWYELSSVKLFSIEIFIDCWIGRLFVTRSKTRTFSTGTRIFEIKHSIYYALFKQMVLSNNYTCTRATQLDWHFCLATCKALFRLIDFYRCLFHEKYTLVAWVSCPQPI